MICSNAEMSSSKDSKSMEDAQDSMTLDPLAAPSRTTSNNSGENTSFLKRKCFRLTPHALLLTSYSNTQDTSADSPIYSSRTSRMDRDIELTNCSVNGLRPNLKRGSLNPKRQQNTKRYWWMWIITSKINLHKSSRDYKSNHQIQEMIFPHLNHSTLCSRPKLDLPLIL